jgi:hypothetical protein
MIVLTFVKVSLRKTCSVFFCSWHILPLSLHVYMHAARGASGDKHRTLIVWQYGSNIMSQGAHMHFNNRTSRREVTRIKLRIPLQSKGGVSPISQLLQPSIFARLANLARVAPSSVSSDACRCCSALEAVSSWRVQATHSAFLRQRPSNDAKRVTFTAKRRFKARLRFTSTIV